MPTAAEVDAAATGFRRVMANPVRTCRCGCAGAVHRAAVHGTATSATGLHAAS